MFPGSLCGTSNNSICIRFHFLPFHSIFRSIFAILFLFPLFHFHFHSFVFIFTLSFLFSLFCFCFRSFVFGKCRASRSDRIPTDHVVVVFQLPGYTWVCPPVAASLAVISILLEVRVPCFSLLIKTKSGYDHRPRESITNVRTDNREGIVHPYHLTPAVVVTSALLSPLAVVLMSTGNPHGSHDGYRAGTGMVLLTRAYTCTRGTGLHTRRSLPPSTRDNDDTTTTAPCPRLVLTHPHV